MLLSDHLLFPVRLLLALLQRRRERADLARHRTGAGKVALGYRVSAQSTTPPGGGAGSQGRGS